MNHPQENTDIQAHMTRCLELAATARACGDAYVGSLIVRSEIVVAEAYERVVALNDPTAHAEIMAIRLACGIRKRISLADCTLVTNVEPCWMCSCAIRETGIGRIVILRSIDEIGGVTSNFPILTTLSNSEWRSPPEIIWRQPVS